MFRQYVTLEDVTQAYLSCRNNKRNKEGSVEFELDLNTNIHSLYQELSSGEYSIGRSTMFIVTHPKPREVWSACFRDRVTHHLIFNRIGESITNNFSANSCACIEERGTLYGVERLQKGIKRTSDHWKEDTYYLKMDLANFFMSINKDILQKLIIKDNYDPLIKHLLKITLNNDPTLNYIYKGKGELKDLIPPYKSLLHCDKGFGLPIGNLSSQFFANIILNVLDKFVDHVLKPSCYVRYVDDIVLVSNDKQFLLDCKRKLEDFVINRLDLRFNSKKTLLHNINRGVDFVGFVIKPYRTVSRSCFLSKAKKKILESSEDKQLNAINSFLGLIGRYNNYNVRVDLLKFASGLGYTAHTEGNKVSYKASNTNKGK